MVFVFSVFFFNDTATTEIYTLSLHDALPIYLGERGGPARALRGGHEARLRGTARRDREHHPLPERAGRRVAGGEHPARSEEHTSELQSRQYLVCRLLLEKKNKPKINIGKCI